jgi:hypothetical protein
MINTVFPHQEIGNKLTYDRDFSHESFFQKKISSEGVTNAWCDKKVEVKTALG